MTGTAHRSVRLGALTAALAALLLPAPAALAAPDPVAARDPAVTDTGTSPSELGSFNESSGSHTHGDATGVSGGLDPSLVFVVYDEAGGYFGGNRIELRPCGELARVVCS